MSDSDISQQLLGGALISLAIIVHLLLIYRGIPVSQIIQYILHDQSAHCNIFSTKLSLFLGILTTSAVAFLQRSSLFENSAGTGLNYGGYIIAGLFMGLGAALAAGGFEVQSFHVTPMRNLHGLLSAVIMLASAFVIATSKDSINFLQGDSDLGIKIDTNNSAKFFAAVSGVVFVLFCLYRGLHLKVSGREIINHVISFLCGGLYAIGLMCSKLIRPSDVLNFLNFSNGFKGDVGVSILTTVVINVLAFHFIRESVSITIDIQDHKRKELQLVLGSVMFGIGWGLTGLSLGSILVVFTLSIQQITFLLVPSVIVGFFLPKLFHRISHH